MNGGSIYERVPQPPGVMELPKVGLMPVPYITVYLNEEQAAAGDRTIAYGPEFVERAPEGPRIDCVCVFGEGKASIGQQCPVRQRDAMANRLCNVCGQKVEEVDAIFVGASPAAYMNGGMRSIVAGMVSREAPTHRACLGYSALVCPKLRAGGDRVPLAIRAGEYPLVDLWITPDKKELIMPHQTPRVIAGRPVGLLNYYLAKLDDSQTRWTTLGTWMSHAAPAPYRGIWRREVRDAR